MSEPAAPRPAAAPPDDGADALPVGTRLAEFEIRQVLGAGGFGVVYRAWDEALQRDVAIKEYMPVSMAGRGASERVTLRSRLHEENFALGLQSFVNEARLLARFDEPALVKVFRFWEANGTAYMAMPLYRGRTLRQLRREMAPEARDDAWVRALIEPLLGALKVMHDAEVYHRDIAPDNILWCDDDRPVLLDFGAARLVLADRTQNVTAILKPQFAPLEQYAETQAMRQGPWTDLYALAGTCYFMLTGRAPLPATARVLGDELVPLAQLAPPGCSPTLLRALDWAMAVRPQDRPQSVAQWREALAGRLEIPEPAVATMPAPPVAPPADDAFDRTIQATRRAPRDEPPAAHPDAYADTPERSVMLPPKPGFPAKPLLLLVVLAGLGAGAWATRAQWLPALGLQAAVAPAADAASAPEALAASAPGEPAASAPEAASAPAAVAEAASPAADPMASAPAAPAPPTQAAASTPARTGKPAPAPRRTAQAARQARDKALDARLATLTLPPPVLPPANEAHVGGSAPAVAAPARPLRGPREACAEREPGAVGACVRQLCEDDTRYRFYPVCVRLRERGGDAE